MSHKELQRWTIAILAAAALCLFAVFAPSVHAAPNISHGQVTVRDTITSSCATTSAIAFATITTTGSAVKVDVYMDVHVISGQSFTYWGFKIWRDTVQLFDSMQSGQSSMLPAQGTAAFSFFDLPSAATHTYYLVACTNSGGTSSAWPGSGISAWELK